MQRVLIRSAAIALVTGAALAPHGAAADERRAAILANTCFSCHGTEGRSSGAMPSIEGKSASYIADTLKRFRDGDKKSTVMIRIAKGFTDEEIEELAGYFSGKK